MRRIVIALGVIVGIFFIVRAVVELLTIDYSDPSSYEDDWRTEPRGRAAGSLWVGTDRRDLDRRLSVATTFELIEGARAMNRATRCVCWRVRAPRIAAHCNRTGWTRVAVELDRPATKRPPRATWA